MQGFVLKSTTISDHKRIVTLFTLEQGKLQLVFRIAKRGGQAAYISFLNRLSFSVRGREHQLQYMQDPCLEADSFHLGSNYLGLCLLQHLASLVDNAMGEHQPEPHLYRLLQHSLESLPHNWQPARVPGLLLYVESWMLHFSGVLPRISEKDRFRYDSPAKMLYLNDRQLVESKVSLHDGDAQIFADIFNSPIDRFYLNIDSLPSGRIQCDFLTRALGALGYMWDHYLGKPVKTRGTLLAQLKERKLL